MLDLKQSSQPAGKTALRIPLWPVR